MLAPTLLLDPLTPVYWDSVDDFPTSMKDVYATNPEKILIAPNGKYYATSKFQMDDNGNPLLQRDRRNQKSSGFTVRGTAFVDLTPIDGLIMTSRFSYRIAQSNSHDYSEPYYMNGQAKADNYSISANANNNHYYQWENFANFNKTLFDKHNVGAMIGMSYTEYRSDNVSASASGTGGNKILSGDADNFKYLDYVNSASTTTKASATFREYRQASPTSVVCSTRSITVIACSSTIVPMHSTPLNFLLTNVGVNSLQLLPAGPSVMKNSSKKISAVMFFHF